jgi:ATP-dependent Lon protease
MRSLVLPADNRVDFQELPDYLKEGLEVHFANRYIEVADIVFPQRGR